MLHCAGYGGYLQSEWVSVDEKTTVLFCVEPIRMISDDKYVVTSCQAKRLTKNSLYLSLVNETALCLIDL